MVVMACGLGNGNLCPMPPPPLLPPHLLPPPSPSLQMPTPLPLLSHALLYVTVYSMFHHVNLQPHLCPERWKGAVVLFGQGIQLLGLPTLNP